MTFRFVSVLLLSSFFFACSDDTVIDSSLPNDRISFRSLTLNGYIFDTDSISVLPGTEKRPEDLIHLTLTAQAEAIESNASISDISVRVLVDGKDNEIVRASLARTSGSTFRGTVKVPIKRGDVGDYRVEVQGTDNSGGASERIFTKITVIYGSSPPFICGITAPDTVDLPQSGIVVIKIAACVRDNSGQADIKRVLFNSFLPSGIPSSGNPFILVDDGTKGDLRANDGTYSLDIQLPSTSQKGNYRFEFQAFDLSNLSSDVVIHTIVVR